MKLQALLVFFPVALAELDARIVYAGDDDPRDCSTVGCRRADSEALCEDLAEFLGLSDTSAGIIAQSWKPKGCLYLPWPEESEEEEEPGLAAGLYFNTGGGSNCEEEWRCVCDCSVATSSPTSSPTPAPFSVYQCPDKYFSPRDLNGVVEASATSAQINDEWDRFQLIFDKIVEELDRIDDGTIPSSNCGKTIVFGKDYGDGGSEKRIMFADDGKYISQQKFDSDGDPTGPAPRIPNPDLCLWSADEKDFFRSCQAATDPTDRYDCARLMENRVGTDCQRDVAGLECPSCDSTSPTTAPTSAPGPDLPDLIIFPDNAEINAVAERKYTVTYQVKNIGDTISKGDFRDWIYLSNDNVLDASDVVIRKSFLHSLNIPAGMRTSLHTRDIEIPCAILPGTYFILIQADGPDVVLESNEDNNVLSFEITIAPSLSNLPDLIVYEGAELGPPTANLDTTVDIDVTYRIQNIGEKVSRTPFREGLFYSTDNVLDAGDVLLRESWLHSSPINLGFRTSLHTRSLTLPAGTEGGFILIVADGSTDGVPNVVAESNEDNNVKALSFSVCGDSGSPDIIVYNTPLEAGVPVVNGDGSTSIDVTFRLKNIGDGISCPEFRDLFVLSADTTLDGGDLILGESFLHNRPINAGWRTSTRTVTVTIPAGTPAAGYILIVADGATNAVPESDENNNVAAIAVVHSV